MEQIQQVKTYRSYPLLHPLEEIKILTTDGLVLHGWHIRARRNPIGNFIMVHGLKDYSERYMKLAYRLSDLGYEVFGFDLRGHAQSEGDRVYFESLEQIMRDFDSAIKAFKNNDNYMPWILMGHSAGAALTARYVIDHPNELSAYILSAPILKRAPNVNLVVEGGVRLLSNLIPHLKVLDLPNEDFSSLPEVVESMSTDPLIEDGKVPARTAANMLDNMDYVMRSCDRNILPFLVLHSEADKINMVEGSKEFFERTPESALKQKIIYKTLAHDLLHEPEHVMVENDIISWLGKLDQKLLH